MHPQLNHRPHCGPIFTPRWEGVDMYIISKILFYNFYFRNYSIHLKFLKKLGFFKHLKFWIPLWLISDHRKIGTSLKSTIL